MQQLHAADVLQSDVVPDTQELLLRYQRSQRQKKLQNIRSPLAIRLPLVDPERWLERGLVVIRFLFGSVGAVTWLAVVTMGLWLTIEHWPELTENVTERVLAPQNLMVLWLTFPVVKIIHELGHAFAVKAWGGEVHEMGIMFLVLSPVPYVDASAASAFVQRARRVAVGGAGMMTELFVAAIALYMWSITEPGILRTVMYNVVLIASVSTLVFNGNPLLRFDAYYMLADALEVPNLASRANRYFYYLCERYLFGLKTAVSPITGPGEAGWFLSYAVAAFFYRLFIYFVIITFIASQFLVVGVILAMWAAFSMLLMPIGKGVKYLVSSPKLDRQRPRALFVTASILVGLAAAVTLIPVPLATVAEGVIWVPEHAFVRAETGGFVRRVVGQGELRVDTGDEVLVLEDPLLLTELNVLEQELAAQRTRFRVYATEDRVQANVTADAIRGVEARLASVRERLRQLQVRSPASGRLILPNSADLLGRFIPQGKHLGYVVNDGDLTVRVSVPQSEVDLVRQRTASVQIRLSERVGDPLAGVLMREVPAASSELPSPVLGTTGGGAIVIDPSDERGLRTVEKVFQFQVGLPSGTRDLFVGARAYVRFSHGSEPLAFRWYRSARQLLLSQFSV